MRKFCYVVTCGEISMGEETVIICSKETLVAFLPLGDPDSLSFKKGEPDLEGIKAFIWKPGT